MVTKHNDVKEVSLRSDVFSSCQNGVIPRFNDDIAREGPCGLAGEKLSDDEFGVFVVTLAVADNEATRNTITQGMMAFCEHPISASRSPTMSRPWSRSGRATAC